MTVFRRNGDWIHSATFMRQAILSGPQEAELGKRIQDAAVLRYIEDDILRSLSGAVYNPDSEFTPEHRDDSLRLQPSISTADIASSPAIF